jgi:hypothetical protein
MVVDLRAGSGVKGACGEVPETPELDKKEGDQEQSWSNIPWMKHEATWSQNGDTLTASFVLAIRGALAHSVAMLSSCRCPAVTTSDCHGPLEFRCNYPSNSKGEPFQGLQQHLSPRRCVTCWDLQSGAIVVARVPEFNF